MSWLNTYIINGELVLFGLVIGTGFLVFNIVVIKIFVNRALDKAILEVERSTPTYRPVSGPKLRPRRPALEQYPLAPHDNEFLKKVVKDL